MVELVVVLSIIILMVATVLPSVIKLFNAGSDAQAKSLLSAQLGATRGLAVTSGTYAALHVQMDNAANAKKCYLAIFRYENDPNEPATYQTFVLDEGFAPKAAPGGYAFVEVSDATLNTNGDGFDGPISNNNLDDMTSFTIVFDPSGAAVKHLGGEKIVFDTTDDIFGNYSSSNKNAIWKSNLVNGSGGTGEEGVTTVALFRYTEVEKLSPTGRVTYLDRNTQFLPINVHTGQLLPRK